MANRVTKMITRIFDFSLGLMSDVSDFVKKARYVRRVDNMLFRPLQSLTSRQGSRDVTSAKIDKQPNSLGKYYSPAGNNLYMGASDLSTDPSPKGYLYRITGTQKLVQTLPFVPTFSGWWTFANVNSSLVAQQWGSLQAPIFFDASSAPENWLSCKLPKPGFPPTAAVQAVTSTNPPLAAATTNQFIISEGDMAFTTTAAANGTGNDWSLTIGGVATPHVHSLNVSQTFSFLFCTPSNGTGALTSSTTYYYRLRHRFSQGSSRAGNPVSVVMGVADDTVDLTSFPTSARTDYLGWTLERTRAGSTSAGPFYFIADGTGQTYQDGRADNTLYSLTDDEIHAQPVPFEGVIGSGNRLYGWTKSAIYVSQSVGDAEATGPFNFDPENIIYVAKDDGDSIACLKLQSDRIIIYKHRSFWALTGDNPDNFQLLQLYDGIGACGPRAVAGIGTTHFFHSGKTGMFRLDGNQVTPVGWREVGYYKNKTDLTRMSEILMVNYIGEFVMCWLPLGGNAFTDDILVYDLRFRNWTHFKGWRAVDALVQKDDFDFNSASLLLADQKNSNATVPTNEISLRQTFMAFNYTIGGISKVYAQSFSPTGSKAWGALGTRLDTCGKDVGQYMMQSIITPDEFTSIVCFTNNTNAPNRVDIHVQKLNSSGTVQWGAIPGPVVTNAVGGSSAIHRGATVSLKMPRMVHDGTGGCWIAWNDDHTGQETAYLQHFNAAGAALLAANGQVIDATVSTQAVEDMVPDGTGGVAVLYTINTAAPHTFIRRFNSAGASVWSSEIGTFGPGNDCNFLLALDNKSPLWVCAVTHTTTNTTLGIFTSAWEMVTGTVTQALTQRYSQAIPGQFSGHSCGDGAVVIYQPDPLASGIVTATRVNVGGTAGTLTWGAPGAWQVLANAFGNVLFANAGQYRARSCTDNNRGGIIAWLGYRDSSQTERDLFVQRHDVNGATLWAFNGINVNATLLSGTAGISEIPFSLCSDGGGGCIISFTSPNSDFIRISSSGAAVWNQDITTDVTSIRSARQLLGGTVESTTPQIDGAGYHLWSANVGQSEYADTAGLGGLPINVGFQTALMDDGAPDVDKDYDRISVHAESGDGDFVVGMLFDLDDSAPISVPLSRNTSTIIWPVLGVPDSHWNDGQRWNNTAAQIRYESGIPEGTIGRRYSLQFSGKITDQLTVNGYVVDSYVLPTRDY